VGFHYRLVPLAEECLKLERGGPHPTALDLELADGNVVADSLGETDCIFLASLYRAGAGHRREATRAFPEPSYPGLDRRHKAFPWIEIGSARTGAKPRKRLSVLHLASKVS